MPSQYQNRTYPAYDSVMQGLVRPSMANNSFILKWWKPEHDEIIKRLITEWQWYWYHYITGEVVKYTDPTTIEKWKKEDIACRRGIGSNAWYNVLEFFAFARADQLGFSQSIRKAKWKTCPLCKEQFLENSLPEPLAKRFGVNGLDFCAPCLTPRILQSTGNETLSKEEIKQYLQQLSKLLDCVPHQGYSEGDEDLLYLNYDERLAVLQLLSNKPKTKHVRKHFNSWLQALIESGVLEDGTRKTSRGTMCLAKDGHTCLSLAEKTLDDFLFNHGIPHTREPHYPGSNYRADFDVKGVFIEHFGLAGNESYDQKIEEKKKIAKDAGIRMIPIYPKNLLNTDWLGKTLLSI